MNLVIDIGNTHVKIALFRDKELFLLHTASVLDQALIHEWTSQYKTDAAIISTVRRKDSFTWLTSGNFPVLFAGADLKLPIKLLYKTPETLGSDRLAAAIAAADMFPGQNCLAIVAGSCITTEMVTANNEYAGGTISPGMHMRMRAMNHFTGQLPLLENIAEQTPLLGNTTESSMMSGVINGITAEIQGFIDALEKEIGFFNVIFSGGDGKIFAKKLKSRIFAVDNLVLHGLNLMLKHNV